jgi:hypothetical protein
VKRSLYIVVPDAVHAQSWVDDLLAVDIDKQHMHTVAKDTVDLGDLPSATNRQPRDTVHRLEHWFWRANLAVFVIALAGLLFGLTTVAPILTVITLATVFATFVIGAYWAHAPDTELSEFHDALLYREALFLVGVPGTRVAEIGALAHKRHPEAIVGGTS